MNAILVIIAAATIGSAIVAMAGKNLLHSVLLLACSWAGVAVFFLWAGAEFAAFAQVLVYIGAISMVVLFAVLLTRRSRDDVVPATASRSRKPYAAVIGVSVAAVLLTAVARWHPEACAYGSTQPAARVGRIGRELMGTYAPALLVVGALLTVALIGAVVLAAVDRPGGTEDAP
jgi:NADH:ubiquinone oxidoreductase subunit 6 (subunit J)